MPVVLKRESEVVYTGGRGCVEVLVKLCGSVLYIRGVWDLE